MRYAWVVTGTPPHCTPFEEIQAWDMQHHPSINNVHPMRILQFWLLRYLYNTELPGRPRAFLSLVMPVMASLGLHLFYTPRFNFV